MSEGKAPEPGIQVRRQKAVDRLMESFANDVMEVEEFERRVDLAHRAGTTAALDALLADLPSNSGVPMRQEDASLAPRQLEMVPVDQVRERSVVVACLGGTERKGRWVPARRSNVVTIMGGASLDFREALMGPGVTEMWIFTMMGGVEIIVPPGMPVEVDGVALMGGFDFDSNEPTARSPDQPLLRIRGMAVMGGVEVAVRDVGETSRDARRRRKLEKKLRRRLKSGREQ
jgi:uncharacterized protein DUF1707/cell wall-active antibiotic response 4TMS protein YvqF